jgi:alpha-tubulin suppressor-like RCC1 family protein
MKARGVMEGLKTRSGRRLAWTVVASSFGLIGLFIAGSAACTGPTGPAGPPGPEGPPGPAGGSRDAAPLVRPTAISAGASQACAVLSDGSVWCWGFQASTQANSFTLTPTQVLTEVPVGGPTPKHPHAIPIELAEPLTHVTSVSAGLEFACALIDGGKVTCWGSLPQPLLDSGISNTAVTVPGLTGVTAISVGDEVVGAGRAFSHKGFVCARLSGGTVSCWGPAGSPFNGDIKSYTNNGQQTKLDDVTAISAGRNNACALLADGTIVCWGAPGVADSVTTFAVPAMAISAGSNFNFALLKSGEVESWGVGAFGELRMNPLQHAAKAVVAGKVSPLVEDAVGQSVTPSTLPFACALTEDGAVACWGNNRYGQLGVASDGGNYPIWVMDVTTATAVSAGDSFACALLADSTIDCWGNNKFGQLGNGTTIDSATPVPVVPTWLSDVDGGTETIDAAPDAPSDTGKPDSNTDATLSDSSPETSADAGDATLSDASPETSADAGDATLGDASPEASTCNPTICEAMGTTGEYTCQDGTCQLAPCPTLGDVNCSGSCIDPTTDGQHCGASTPCATNPGAICGGTGTCSRAGGVTKCVCTLPEISCSTGCILPSTSTTNCGASDPCATNPGINCTVAPYGAGFTCNGTACVCQGPSSVLCGTTCYKDDPNNCGRCGHSCNGGTCYDGLCTPVVLVSGMTADFRGRDSIVADSSGVYFNPVVGNALPTDQLMVCGTTTCASPAVVFTGGGEPLALQGGRLYFEANYVTEVLSEGSTTASVFSDSQGESLASDASNLYLLSDGVAYFASLTGTPPVTPTVAFGTLSDVAAMAVDPTNLYVADSTANVIASCSSVPCTTTYTTVASAVPAAVTALTSDGTNVWFSTSAALYRCPISTGCATPLTPYWTVSGITDITVDTTNAYVYWAAAGIIQNCTSSAATCPGPFTVSPNGAAAQFAQNQTAIYFTNYTGGTATDAIYMISK